MRFMINTFKSFTKLELGLWLSSSLVIIVSFLVLNTRDNLTLMASLLGATALILLSKGNVLGQILTVAFSIVYGIISYSYNYYGEMITYLGMTAPIAIISIITWLKNSFKGDITQVKIASLQKKEFCSMIAIGILVAVVFFFILKSLNTNRLILSTISIFTSFIASYLTMRRCRFYALAYAVNDIILIALWILATIDNIKYLPMIMCFAIFLCNDLYAFINWSRSKKLQSLSKA